MVLSFGEGRERLGEIILMDGKTLGSNEYHVCRMTTLFKAPNEKSFAKEKLAIMVLSATYLFSEQPPDTNSKYYRMSTRRNE
jgi:hypothetical protein